MKVAMITGSYPPMRCGVGDYTYQLVRSLCNSQTEAHVFTSAEAKLNGKENFFHSLVKSWSIWPTISLARRVQREQPDIVHIQYPTIGYGYNLGPQILSIFLRMLGLKIVTTIHEFQQANVLRKISLLPFFIWSNVLIFTSEEERVAVINSLPWLRKKLNSASYVIPVGSNIPATTHMGSSTKGSCLASFFGLFYPGRQIELVVKAFQDVVLTHKELKFRFIGDIHPRHREYFLKIKELVEKSLPSDRVEWYLGKSPEDISIALGQSDVCILPFPDGVSFRRTTFIAALSLGVPVITTKGNSTPDILADGLYVLFANNEKDIATMIGRVLTDQELSHKLTENAMILSSKFSWDRISEDHLKVYLSIIGR